MKKIKFISQASDNECGLCCVAMISSYYGKDNLISYYRNKYKVGRDGISLYEIVKLMINESFVANAMKLDNIEDLLMFDKPIILYLKFNHYVVMQKNKKNSIIIYDPSNGKRIVSLKELESIFGGYIIEVYPNKNFKTTNKSVSEYRYLFKILRNIKGIFAKSLIITLLSYFVSMLTPLQIQIIVDKITNEEILVLYQIFLLLIILILITALLSVIRNRTLIQMQIRLFNEITENTIAHLLKIPYPFFDNRSTGNILFRLEIMGQLRNFVANNIIQIIISFISIIVIILYLCFFFSKILFFILISVALMGILILLVGKNLLELQMKNLSHLEDSNKVQTEIVSNIFQIKCLKLEDYFLSNFIIKFSKFKESFALTQKIGMDFNLVINLISMFVPIIVFILAATIFNFGYTLGQLFFLYTLISAILNATYNLFNQLLIISSIRASLFYLNDLLDEKELVNNGLSDIKEFKNISLKNIDFKYSMSTENILKSVSLKINKSEKVALVGYSGSGKSTLVKIISGLYTPDSGNILVNDIKLHDLNDDSLKSIISIVPQTPILFNKTIKENLLLGKTCDDDQIYDALKIACFDEEVRQMPMGLNTMISSNGGNLSGGQIQRLAIARALLNNSSLLVLDEATSSLDKKNEEQIYFNLKQKGITVLVITHRLASIYDADNIYVLDKGKIIANGKHMDLIDKCTIYKSLINDKERKELR